jgi:hypothetical protein
MDKPLPKGATFYLIFGKNGGFYWKFSAVAWRVCLWRVAFTVLWFDGDYALDRALDLLEREKEEVAGHRRTD